MIGQAGAGQSTSVRAVAAAGRISYWFRRLAAEEAESFARRPQLTESREADVCIVGAGYTGLWTAYELLRRDPALEIVVLEAEVAGYGASGRNGGAVIAQLNGSRAYWAKRGGRGGAVALEQAVQAAVDEVGAAVDREGIDCGFSKNGVLIAARSELELRRLQAAVAEDREWGFGTEDSVVLDAAETRDRVAVEGAIGARFSPHCASVDPGALVRGLARAVERAGATIYEDTRVTTIEPGAVAVTATGVVRARVVVRATEAYSESLACARRRIVPVHTSMLVTEPLDDATWAEIHWQRREALLAEHPFLHLQRTREGRITIGGDDNRVPYRFGSRPSVDGPAPAVVAEHYRRELVRLFPVLAGVRVDHSWQGVFGASRAWAPSVGFDRGTGIAWADGYVGEGVAASNLAGRTLVDLIAGHESELTRLPWVGKQPRRWEPEPLRVVGAGLIWALRYIGEQREARTGRPSRLPSLGNRLAGFTGHLG